MQLGQKGGCSMCVLCVSSSVYKMRGRENHTHTHGQFLEGSRKAELSLGCRTGVSSLVICHFIVFGFLRNDVPALYV